MKLPTAISHRVGAFLVLTTFLVVGLSAWGQSRNLGRIKDFKLPDFYPATGLAGGATNRLKTLITGAEAIPQAGGVYRVKAARIENYSRDGKTNVITQTPECLLNYQTKVVHSAGPLEVVSGDGQFQTAGTGFLCRMTNYHIWISNDVRTVIRQLAGNRFAGLALGRAAVPPPGKTNAAPAVAAPITIESRQLELDREANRILYSGAVQVDNPQLHITGARLRLQLNTNSAIEQIIAEEQVRITSKQDASRATADRAIYRAEGDRRGLELIGNAHWQDGLRSGQAGILQFDPVRNTLLAQQQAVLRLPRAVMQESGSGRNKSKPKTGQGKSPGEPLPSKAAQAPTRPHSPSPTNQFVEVRAEWLTAQLPTRERPQRTVTAKTNVVILSPADRSRASGDEATYAEAGGLLVLQGQAQWEDDQHFMRAHRLEYDRSNAVFRARQDAYLKLRIAALGRPQSLGGNSRTNAGKSSRTNQFIEVNCQDMDLQNSWLTFRKAVHGRLLETNTVLGLLQSDLVRLKVPSNQLERLEIHGHVHFEQPPTQHPAQPRIRRTLDCEWLEADLYPGGFLRHVVVRTNVVALQETWAAGASVPRKTIFAADAVTADFLPGTNAVAHARAVGHVETRYGEKSARGDEAIYTAANDLLLLQGHAELRLSAEGAVRSSRFSLRPFQRWLRHGSFGPFGLPVLPPGPAPAAPNP